MNTSHFFGILELNIHAVIFRPKFQMANVPRHPTIGCITAFDSHLCQCDIVYEFIDIIQKKIQIINIYDKDPMHELAACLQSFQPTQSTGNTMSMQPTFVSQSIS